jgi:hypothetical protein
MEGETPQEIKKLGTAQRHAVFRFDDTAIVYAGRSKALDKDKCWSLSWKQRKHDTSSPKPDNYMGDIQELEELWLADARLKEL